MNPPSFLRCARLSAAAVALLLAACAASAAQQEASPQPAGGRAAGARSSSEARAQADKRKATGPVATVRTSAATTPRAYRADAASHIYGLNRDRIWKGRLPPLLYAIGVLQVEIDGRGRVRRLSWMRAPRHAPQVIREIERTVRAAAPYPAPVRMGRVVYTDTWLWHKSGRFQLDTLTEGQD